MLFSFTQLNSYITLVNRYKSKNINLDVYSAVMKFIKVAMLHAPAIIF